MEEIENENRQFAKFERADDYFKLLGEFLNADLWAEQTEDADSAHGWVLLQLQLLLNEYQEQAWLLDPYLERMLGPPIEALRDYGCQYVRMDPKTRPTISPRVNQLAMLLYWITKTRGHKTVEPILSVIACFFPHQVQDVMTTVSFARNSDPIMDDFATWPFRYILILWLYAIANIPFDLARFDKAGSDLIAATALEDIGKCYLHKSGVESESSALLLSRLYTRNDTSSRLPGFLQWAKDSLLSRNDRLVIGILRVIGEILQSSTNQQSCHHRGEMVNFVSAIREDERYTSNSVVRKWLSKLTGRISVVALPPPRMSNIRKQAKVLRGGQSLESRTRLLDEEPVDITEDAERALEYLFAALEDRDTIVRYSAAKWVARIAERLPSDFMDQVLENILSLFSIHAVDEDGDLDIPTAAEATWHGACLACAEFARRGLVSDSRLPDLLHWMYKALYFDIRKGSHSIGSSVRDAAAYVFWSLARAQTTESIRPFSIELARRLVAVSVYDREVHIRRAASAAFQEHVGRLGIFPHGIDVLRKTDFFAVSVRKNAFLSSAPEVAGHLEYRLCLIDHLISISLRHWDPAMRVLASQSLGCLSQLDLTSLGPEILNRLSTKLNSVELNEVHGALLSLAELAVSFGAANPPQETNRLEVFRMLGKVPSLVLKKYGNELVLSALCDVIATSASETALSSPEATKWWRPVTDRCIQHRDSTVQEAAARAFASELHSSPPPLQQSLTCVLGVLSYSKLPHGIIEAVDCLLNCVNVKSPKFLKNIEARRNSFRALSKVIENSSLEILHEIGPSRFQEIFRTLTDGLHDYTTDERGDVGSWIRISCIQAIGISTSRLFVEPHLSRLEDWLPRPLYCVAVAGILKQGAERLDNVRQEAGIQILGMLQRADSETETGHFYRPDGHEILWKLFDSEQPEWLNPTFIFPRIVEVLRAPAYRQQLLQGLTLSIGSRNQGTLRPASDALVQLCLDLPITSSQSHNLSLVVLLEDLYLLGRENYTSNQSFIPVLLALELIFRDIPMEQISDVEEGSTILKKALDLACRSSNRFKNVQRITASMKISIVMLSCPLLRQQAIPYVEAFLNHSFPTIRSATAEQLYLALQMYSILEDDEQVDHLLLETPWSGSPAEYSSPLASLIKLLKGET